LPDGINVYGGRKEENILLVELCVSKIGPSDEIFDEIALARIGGAKDEKAKAFLRIRKEWICQWMTGVFLLMEVDDAKL
jgi:hypothetical protein